MRLNLKNRRLWLGAGASVLVIAASGVVLMGRSAGGSSPEALTVNHATDPLGMESAPRFAWQSGVDRQTAYQVQVGRYDGADPSGELVWDSERVESAEDIEVAYDGPELAGRDRYWWRVRVWDQDDEASAWSEKSSWEMGLLDAADWTGKWIGGRPSVDHDWADMTFTSNFRVTDAAKGIGFMFHAQPVGKTWGEGYVWRLSAPNGQVQLDKISQRYSGAPYNPQSETNPASPAIEPTTIGTVPQSALAGLTADSLANADHEISITVRGNTITTRIDGQDVDSTTVDDANLVHESGTVGFFQGAGSDAPPVGTSYGVVKKVTVTTPDDASPEEPAFTTDFADHANPFENGVPSAGNGLTLSGNPALPIAKPAPLVRTEFDVAGKDVETARLYVAGGGWPRVTLNGEAVTEDLLLGGHTAMDRTVLYTTIDVTDQIESGKANALAAELGRGWYGLTTPDEWMWQMANYQGEPRLLAQLEITYTDGETTTVTTDPGKWTTADGPTTYDSLYTGDSYDAQIAAQLAGYDEAGFDSSDWTPAVEMAPPGSCPEAACEGFIPDEPPTPQGFVPAELHAQESDPVRVVGDVEAVAVTSPEAGVHIFDFGQNMTGHAQLDLTGTTEEDKGKTVLLRHDELLDDAGQLLESGRMKDGRHQEDAYTVAGTGDETWEPSFGYRGFRYVEVRGLEEVLGRAPTLDDAGLITARNVRTAYPETGELATDNELLNRIQSNVQWAGWNNTVLKPTDTPNREKNGWTGDTAAAGETYMLNNDTVRFFEGWARSLRDAQISTGEVPEIVPATKGWYGYDGTPGWASTEGPTPSWDAAYFVMPWELYQYSGNLQLLRDMYPTQQRFMDYYAQWFNAGNGYAKPANVVELGDWAATGGLGTTVINQQWNYYFADYMAKAGELVGEGEAAAGYRAEADEILTWFVDQYWDPTTHSYQSDEANLESVNVMAIEFGMIPGSDLDPTHAAYRADEQKVADNEASAADVVAADIESRGYHLGAGVFGMHYLFGVLDEFGHTDVLYRVATQTETPSWGFQISQGATSLWEQWDSGSQNHPYLNSIGTWFYQGLGGITPAEPGYRSVLIRPYIPTVEGTSSVPSASASADGGTGAALETSTLDEVSASIDTARGTVASEWARNSDGTIELSVTIPGNTPAEVWVPTMDKEVRAPSGLDASGTDVAGGKPYAVFDVPPGTWTFNG